MQIWCDVCGWRLVGGGGGRWMDAKAPKNRWLEEDCFRFFFGWRNHFQVAGLLVSGKVIIDG